MARLKRAWWGQETCRQRNVQHETAVDDSAVSILQVATNLKIVSGIEVGGTGGQFSGIMAIGEAESCEGEEIMREVEEELRHGKRKHKANALYFPLSAESCMMSDGLRH